VSKTHALLKSSKFGEHSVIERLESVLDASTGKQCAISKRDATDGSAGGGWCKVLELAGIGSKEEAAGHTRTRTRVYWQATVQSQGPGDAWPEPPENSVLAVTRTEESHGQRPESRKLKGLA